jgi:hypothetical protein
MESVKFRGQTGVGRSDEQSESRMWRELKNAEHSACLKHRLPPQNSQATPKPDFISRSVFLHNSLMIRTGDLLITFPGPPLDKLLQILATQGDSPVRVSAEKGKRTNRCGPKRRIGKKLVSVL